MSFQQVLYQNAQQGALEVDEALAFLDDFDMCTSCDHHEDPTLSSSSLSSNGNSSSVSSWSDELSSVSPDDSLFAHLTESTVCEFSNWEVALQVDSQQQQQQQGEHHESQQSRTKPQTQIQQQGKKKNERVRKNTNPKIKKTRKNNRIEILKLRELVEQLQARYSDLQKSTAAVGSLSVSVSAVAQQFIQKGAKQRKAKASGGTVSNVAPSRSVWLEVAVEQYKHLQQSERLNRKLRDAVTKQLKLTNSLQALFQKKVTAQELEAVGVALEGPVPSTKSLYKKTPNTHEAILTTLYRSVESQFHETDTVLHSIRASNDVASAFCTSSTKQDAVQGLTLELVTNTPVQSHFQLIGHLMWNRAVERNPSGVLTEPQTKQGCASSSHFLRGFFENQVRILAPSKFGELKVNGVILVCKHEEAQRTVMTIASAYTLDGSCLVFRENGWIVVSSDGGNAGGAKKQSAPAMFQTFTRIRSEKQDPSSSTGSSPFPNAPDEKTAYIQEVVINALGNQMRQHTGAIQKSLLSEAKPITARVMEYACPLFECTC